ncbi:hypothetical protein ACFJZ3_002544 [Vibrio vulnificus]|nr:hypothetical protein [Vibrio vulnificus]
MIEKIRNGAFWVSIISLLAMPFAYYRSWILNQIDSTGELLGLFALLLVFIELAITMSIFGGASSLANYIPKISGNNNRFRFIFSFSIVSILFSLIFLLVLRDHRVIDFLSLSDIYENNVGELFFLTILLVISQIGIYCLNGFFKFRLSSFLSNIQVVFVCFYLTVVYFYQTEIDNQTAIKQIMYLIISVYVLVSVVSFVKINFFSVSSVIGRFCYFPTGFFKFSIFMHGNTFCTMVYLTADRIILASKFGLSTLAMYYVFSQIAEVIRFIPNKIGQVLLASFSKMENSLSGEELKSSYKEVIENIVLISSVITISIIIFSSQISGFFNYSSKENILMLNLLTIFTCIGAIGPVNAMLVMSKEKSVDYFLNSIFQIASQLVFIFTTIDELGIYSVVFGKGIGIIFAQFGLLFILRFRLKLNFASLPLSYYACQFICIINAVLVYMFEINIKYSFVTYLLSMFFVMIFNRKAFGNIKKIFVRRVEVL